MFEDIKVGDQVIVGESLQTVEHVTATRFKAGNYTFLKDGGRRYGGSSYSWRGHLWARKAEGDDLLRMQKKEFFHLARKHAETAFNFCSQATSSESQKKYTKEQGEKLKELAEKFLHDVNEVFG